MKRLTFLSLVAAAALAQIPADTLVMKLAERDTPQKQFLRDNPGAAETVRLEHAVHYRKANGENVAIFASNLNWADAGNQIVPMAPEMWQTTVGFRQIGTPTVVRIVSGKTQDTIEMYDAVTGKVITITSPKLNRTGDWTFEFPWESINWTMDVTPFGWNVTSDPIAAARGVRTYQMPLASSGADPQPDPATGDLVDGSFRITRAVMVGADGSSTACSAWTRSAKYVAFVCDDTTLPAEAFPYHIDPQSQFNLGANTGDDGAVAANNAPTWPPTTGNSVWDYVAHNRASDYMSASYHRAENLTRWDTSSIPDNAVVTAATLHMVFEAIAGGYQSTPRTCQLRWDWTDPAIWPLHIGDYVQNPGSSAYAGPAYGLVSWTGYDFTLSSPGANVSKTGYTALRGSIIMNAAPYEAIYPMCYYDQTDISDGTHTTRPYLVVTYNVAPQVVSGTPNSGTIAANTWQTFAMVYRDADAYAELEEMRLLVAYGVDQAYACAPIYVRSANGLALLNDTAGGWLGWLTTPGTGSLISNSQCDLDPAASSASCSGTDCTVNFRLRFKPAFSYGGWVKHTYGHVWQAGYAAESGWQDFGTWTLLAGGPKLIVVSQ